jgi:hypothetical protein
VECKPPAITPTSSYRFRFEPFEIDLSYPYLLDAAFTGTIYSGGLALLPSDLQTDLSQYYRQLDPANALVKRLVTLAPS